MALQFRVQQWTNNATQGVYFVLQSSTDGVTWHGVVDAAGGIVAGQNQANITTLMNAYHQAMVGDFAAPGNWTLGPVVAGPI